MRNSVGIVAPSSVVPPVEFRIGVEKLKEDGFNVYVHPQCARRHMFYAGRDPERAQGFFDFALNSSFPVVWCARGGYGAARLLPWLERMTAERGIPQKKLLVGYSDATALLEYVRTHWGWSTLHAPMPGLREFMTLKPSEWRACLRLIKGKTVRQPWGGKRLRFIGKAPKRAVSGQLVGGNLSVWVSMTGTRFSPRARDKILFLEDVGEGLYRVDRMVQQLAESGGFDRVKALVLGDFADCRDLVPRVLAAMPANGSRRRVLVSPRDRELRPLRNELSQKIAFREIFGEIGERFGFPVLYGLPVGHGPGRAPLPLGAEYKISPAGGFELKRWDWLIGES